MLAAGNTIEIEKKAAAMRLPLLGEGVMICLRYNLDLN